MKNYTLAFLILLVLTVPATAADDPVSPDGDRPKIGLVLGGGAARGAAHVGVIRILEEQGIPIDYVAGTSMGAIVGALYSLGLSADEIEAALLAVDWADLFDDRTSRQQRSMRRKEDDVASFFPLEFGLQNMHLQTPRAYIAGQKFPFAFAIPGFITAGHESFDDLPIPFRAVATDLETGDIVVIDHGSLIQAVRASMSIPGIFPPVEWEGMLLVDGFLASNVPVQVALDMGADFVIAVDVEHQATAKSREELRTIAGITEQMGRIRGNRATAPEIAKADIVIKPDVESWTGQEFDRMGEIIPLGETAARESVSELRKLGLDAEGFEAWRQSVSDHSRTWPVIDLILLDNRTRISDQVMWHLIELPTNEPLDLAILRRDLEEIYELGLVEAVDFGLDRVDDYNILTLTVREKPYAPYIVHIGAGYSMSYSGASSFLLRARINRREVNRLGAEWRSDISLGAISGIETEFYQPLQYSRGWFVIGSALAQTRIDGFYDGNYTEGQYRQHSLGGGLAAGYNVGNFLQLRAGLGYRWFRTEKRSGTNPVPEDSGEAAGPHARLRVDRLDNHMLPSKGSALHFKWEGPQQWMGTSLKYDRTWGDLTVAATSGRHTFLTILQGGSSWGDLPYYRQYFLGGMRSLSGYGRSHLRGDAFGVATVGLLRRLGGGGLPFASRYYVGLWGEAGNAWDDPGQARFDDLRYCGAVSLIMESPLGLLELGYGKAEAGEYTFHLEFGFHMSAPIN